MQEYEIEFYDKADGSEPAKEFILALDAKMRAKVVRTVGLLREEGPSLREPCTPSIWRMAFLRSAPSSAPTLPVCCTFL